MAFTESDLKKLKASSKIRGFQIVKKDKPKRGNRSKKIPARSKQKEWILSHLTAWCISKSVFDQLRTEYIFHPVRKWRSDYAILGNYKILIEYEGLMAHRKGGTGKSGHLTIGGYMDNVEKYNAATVAGFRVLRYTARNYQELIRELDQLTKPL